MKLLKMLLIPLFMTFFVLTGCDINLDDYIDSSQKNTQTKNSPYHTEIKQEPLTYKKTKQIKLAPLDDIDRPQDAHVQLKYTDKPRASREPRLNYNPPGWHNYRFTYKKDTGSIGKYWAFDRTHLVGYLFSGLNDEPKNLIMGTTHLNRGSYNGMDQSNKNSMLYYEMNLNNWLKENPDYTLDYQVTPLYRNDELVPRQVRLAYTGYTNEGEQVPINFGSPHEQKGNHATVVLLDNKAPNVSINYDTGIAKQTHKLK